MKLVSLVLMAAVVSGCGTLTTVVSNDTSVRHSLSKANTRCSSLPRMYSGVAYDFCKLHSAPTSGYYNWFLGFYFIDLMPSAVLDTVVLPYGIYKQVEDGNISL